MIMVHLEYEKKRAIVNMHRFRNDKTSVLLTEDGKQKYLPAMYLFWRNYYAHINKLLLSSRKLGEITKNIIREESIPLPPSSELSSGILC